VYHITPPDGSWDFVDNGVYEVFLRADHDTVTDLAGNTARPQFGEISDPIGSFEVQIEIVPVGTVFTVDTLTDSIDADLADFMCRDAAGNCSLRAAIQQANVMEGEQTVVFEEAGVYMLTITNEGENIDSAKGDLDIQDDLTIIGHGADQTTINAAKTDRAFEIGTVRVNISRVTITGGDPGPGRDGGGIYNNGNLLLHQSTVVGNSAERGGGIYSDWRGEVPGILTLLETHVDENVATETRGGGVYARDLRVIIQNSSFAGNSSKHAGGAINIFDGELFVTGTTFSQNRTDSGVPSIRSQGGAIYSDSPRSEITTSSFTGNSATSGGAIFTNGTLRVLESRFNSNSAPDFAGAIYANRDVELLEIQQSEFLGNTSRGDGGAIRSYADEVTIRDSLFSDNESENAGGAIQFNDAVGVKIANSMFERNKAVNNSGGAISAERSLEMVDIVHSSFRENTASSAGAILNHTVMTIKDSEFTGNVASQSTGGAIENNDSLAELTILRSVLVNNSADYAGGGVESNGKIVRIGASTIVKNSAPRGANVDGEFESLGGNLIGAGTTLNSGG
ncbi:MAG TPA: hypothetical protein P5307_24210, partial [Pirellulaceae bacterium]|nr:hypothetical protein [Pirellulaceae bacterium]